MNQPIVTYAGRSADSIIFKECDFLNEESSESIYIGAQVSYLRTGNRVCELVGVCKPYSE